MRAVRRRGIEDHREIDAEARARRAGPVRASAHQQLVPQAVRAHDAHRFRAQDADAVEFAFVYQHLQETRVVVGRRDQSAAAGFEPVRIVVRGPVGARGTLHERAALLVPVMHFGEARAVLLPHVETGVVHAQGEEHALFEKFAEAHAGKFLHDIALDVDGDGIEPLFAGLVEQRNVGDAVDQLVEVAGGEHLGLPERVVYRILAAEAVAEAGGVVEQFAHGGLARGLGQFDVALLVVAHQELEIGEFGHVFADGIVELPQAFLVQHHQRHAGDGLGHGIDAEEAVLVHRRIVVDAGEAGVVESRDLAVAHEQPDHAGDILVGDDLAHGGVEFGHAFFGKAGARGAVFALGPGGCPGGQARQAQQQREQDAERNSVQMVHFRPHGL